MKKKAKTLVKGLPSGLALSLMLHGSAFFLAGMLVVFSVHHKEEKKFVPPNPVEAPKMKLRKPVVKVKKTARPRSTTRIVTKVKRADMPEITLPAMSGLGDGFGGSLGGFEIIPDLDQISVFGSSQSVGNDFEGTFYDFKRTRRGSLAPPIDMDKYNEVVGKFIAGGWKTSKFANYYRSPRKLYATSFMIGGVRSELGPWAFGEREIAGHNYLLHYKGKIVYPKGGRFRFWGMGDNVLVVRVGGKVVLDFGNQFSYAWDGKESRRSSYHLAHWPAYIGQWFDLEPGVALDMELIFGETAGGMSAIMLVVEEEGVDYPRNFEQGPMLPIFKTANLGHDQLDAIYKYLYEDHYSVTNGPVFNDYEIARSDRADDKPTEPASVKIKPSVAKAESLPELRIWNLKNGTRIEAEFVFELGTKLVLRNASGTIVKIPRNNFSGEDLDYVELESPPPLKLTFLKEVDHSVLKAIGSGYTRMMQKLVCGLKIEKTNKKPYSGELKVELFTIADEIDGNNYILLDRQVGQFTLTQENDNSYELWGRDTYLMDYLDADVPGAGNRRGEKLKGHMIVVSDERGEIIAQSISNDWMLDIIDILREFPIGRHFNKEGERVFPPRAEVIRFWWDAWL